MCIWTIVCNKEFIIVKLSYISQIRKKEEVYDVEINDRLEFILPFNKATS